ncbi:MAG: hypothetical protein EA393_07110 [Bacteroidetes bacterium]|nr:MAG: hypothetical protein EA393_07110 [Bacteroidota bacterium]
MKKLISFANIFVFIFFIMILSACGPSEEERRQQEIEDSIQLEKDRRELLDRAGRIFESPEDTIDQIVDGDTL